MAKMDVIYVPLASLTVAKVLLHDEASETR